MESIIAPARPSDDRDEQVIAAVLAGRKDMFEVIVRRYSRRLFRVAVSVLRNDAEAEDIVQDAFVSAYQHLHQYAGRALFSTWITRIALYAALAKAAARPKESSLQNDSGDDYPCLVDAGRNPEQSLCQQQSVEFLHEAIASLPENYREVVVMRDLREIDTASTARELCLTEANVKVRLHRAHAILRQNYRRRLRQSPTWTPPQPAPASPGFKALAPSELRR